MSLGIFAFCMVALVGLLPVGLATSRKASNTTVENQIAQEILSKARQASFSALPVSALDYFDDFGNHIPAEGGVAPANYIFRTQAAYEKTIPIPGVVSGIPSLDVARATVTIYHFGRTEPINTYHALIANNGF